MNIPDPLGSAADRPDVADRNVERLLGQAYRPEHPDPAFARRLTEGLCAAAREQARGRASEPPGLPRRSSLEHGEGKPRRSLSRRFRPLAAVAALAAVVLGLNLLLQALSRPQAANPPDDRSAHDMHGRGTPAAMHIMVPRPRPPAPAVDPVAVGATVRTGAGERRRVVLGDDTALYLNENTTVRVDAPRRVSLTGGELFAEVAPAAVDNRFLVHTAGRDLTALGTRFDVRADDAGTGVLVTQGKVEVSGLGRPVHAGEELPPGRADTTPAPRASYALDWARDLMAAADSPLVPRSQYAGGALVAVNAGGQQARLSLRKYHVDVHIEDGFARTTIDQTYFNSDTARLEGTFYFPLPPDASLSRLAMYVDGHLMEGGMAERDYARQVFQTIVTRQRDPALLEWVDGSTFKMRVFPLEGRQEKRIILSYTQRLPVLYGRTQYRFPAGHSLEKVRDWSFHARVRNAGKLEWRCPSHELKATRQGKDLLLDGAAWEVKVDKDVVLELRDPVPPGEGSARFAGAVHEGSRYLMLRYRPALPGKPHKQRRDWVFLFESSGDRDPLLARTQVEVVRSILANAEPDDAFAVLTAGTRTRAFAPKLRPATPENVRAAVDFLDHTHLVGALDLGGALAAARPFLEAGKEPYLVHVGGGIASLGERRADVLARQVPDGTHYVGVAVGKHWSRAFMKAAAERSDGYLTQINPDESVRWRAFDLVSTLNAPRLLGVRVVDNAEKVRFLTCATSVAQGQEVCALACTGTADDALPESVTVSATLDGKPYRKVLRVKDVAGKADYLPRAWAKLEIDRLLAEDATKNKERVVALSKAMYVMTPFTSLLVLENEAMYAQYKVDRGRKDHWAMYPCPPTIPVVIEPLDGQPFQLATAQQQPPAEVLKTILVRVPPPVLTWRGHQAANEPRVVTALDVMTGIYAVPAKDTGMDGEFWGKVSGPGPEVPPPDPVFPFPIYHDRPELGGLYLTGEYVMYRQDNTLVPPGVTVYSSINPAGHQPVAVRGFFDRDGSITGRPAGQGGGSLGGMPGAPAGGGRMVMPGGFGGTGFNGGFGGGGFQGGSSGGGAATMPGGFPGPALGTAIRDGTSNTIIWPGMGGGMIANPYGAGLTNYYSELPAGSLYGDGYYTGPYAANGAAIPGDQLGLPPPATSLGTSRVRTPVTAEALPELGAIVISGNNAAASETMQRGGRVMQRLERTAPIPTPPHSVIRSDALDARIMSLLYGGGQAAPLYARPVYSGDARIFQDLVAYAPGLNTSAADILAVLESEATADPHTAAGHIDQGARRLIDTARKAGWQAVSTADFRIVCDGAGRYAYERTLPTGLAERVVCDGKTLLHLYPELGLAARRTVSRFHRAELAALVPWFVPPAEDLAHGADVRLLDERTVAVVPRAAGDTRTSTQLVFAPDGRLCERRSVEIPSGKVVMRAVYGDDGVVKVFDREGMERTTRRFVIRPAAAPDLAPDLHDLVVLSLPLRTREHVLAGLGVPWNGQIAALGNGMALDLVTADTATGNEEGTQVLMESFYGKGHFGPGLAALWAAGGRLDGLPMPQQLADKPLGRYFTWLRSLNGPDPAAIPDNLGSGLLGRLAQFRQLVQPWVADQPDMVQGSECTRLVQFLRRCHSPEWAWALTERVLGSAHRDTALPGGRDGLNLRILEEDIRAVDGDEALGYAAHYELARLNLKDDNRAEACRLFTEAYRHAAAAGTAPPIDESFRQALVQEGAWAGFVRDAGDRLLAGEHYTAAVTLAWQCAALGDSSLADDLLSAALARAERGPQRSAVSVAALECLWAVHQDERADHLVQSLLTDPSLARRPALWRLGSALAARRGATERQFACLDRALALEFEHLAEIINLQVVRTDYRSLLQHFKQEAAARTLLGQAAPHDFAARLVSAADRWRVLDPDPNEACRLAADTLLTVGRTDLAWDYLTTPLGGRESDAASGLELARALVNGGRRDLAERAYRLAGQADPTNAQVLWEEAQNLAQMGRPAEAREQVRAIARGNWPPQYQGLVQQARAQTGSGW